MSLRTPEQYLESLRDDRVVYYAGERVGDVTAHPDLSLKAHSIMRQFKDTDDELNTVTLPDGDKIHRWFWSPTSRDELLQYVEVESQHEEAAHGAITAGIAGLKILAGKMDAKLGSTYTPRINKFADWFARSDQVAALAMTDAKGDRSKPPHQQADPDLWVRVVERRKDGVVIRGAKTSVSNGAISNELLVLPTHAMSEEDQDYAVACSVPTNAPGVVILSNYVGHPWGEKFRFDRPVNYNHVSHDATIVFNDVFVPWERVFMDGENQYTRELIGYFSTLHRAGNIIKEPAGTKKLIGLAQLMARYNGLEGVSAIRSGIAEMVETAQLLDVLRFTALNRLDFVEGICVPDAVACNLAGLTVSSTRQKYLTFLCELAGGPVLTSPSGLDLENPETGDLIRKYYVGRAGVSAEERLRLVKYIYDISASDTAGFARASSVTAAGSPSARRVAVGRNFRIDECVAMVMDELARNGHN